MDKQIFEGKRRIAVFSDIHSNYRALKACFEDARKLGADGFIFLGDYVSDLADPQKTMDLVYAIRSEYPTVCLRGNRERYMLECEAGISRFSRGSRSGSLCYTYEHLRKRDLDFFRQWKAYDRIEICGISVEVAHATKENDRCYFEVKDPQIQTVFAQMESEYLLTGHSHRQYVQTRAGKTIVNPGSVGEPQGGARWPSYALLRVEGHSITAQLRQIPYDITAVIRAQFENGLVDYGRYWSISILYDVITGEEYAMRLLELVHQTDYPEDEAVWRGAAEQLGMRFTEQEILEFAMNRCRHA